MTLGPDPEAGPMLADLLTRTAAELRQCRAIVLRVEEAVHRLIDGGGRLENSAQAADLQSIDLLDQRLEDLARWVQALSAASPGQALQLDLAKLAGALQLADMARALTGLQLAVQAPATHPAGHAEVF